MTTREISGDVVGTISRSQNDLSSRLSNRLSSSAASWICAWTRMISSSRVAMPASLWTSSSGARVPTSI